MTNFTIEEIEKFLGYSLKKVGVNQYYGPCPYCRQEGGDTKGDNLNFNPNKGIFCGVTPDNEHGKRLAQEILKARYEGKETYKKVSELSYSEKDIEKYSSNLLNDKKMLELVKEATGLSEEVIKECKIGFSKESKVFVFPMVALDDTVTGLEIRVPENHKGKFKFICKTKGYTKDIEKCLSKINSPKEAKKAIICAGYKDGYAFYQYLKDLGQENDYQILTNTNGEPNTARTLETHIEYLQRFEQVILCLDNDKAGKQAVEKVEQSIPIVFYNLNLGRLAGINEYINDFNDLYKYIKSKNITEDIINKNVKLSVHSILKLYLNNPNADLGQKKSIQIDDKHTSVMSYFKAGIYPFKNNYYEISYNPDNSELTYTRKSNFTLNILRTIIFNSLGFENQTEYRLEVVTNIGKRTTKPKILTQKELLDIRNLHEILKEGGIHLHIFNDTQLKNIILEELNNLNEELNIYKNPSLIHHQSKPYWIYKNAIVDLESGNILTPTKENKNIIQLNPHNSVALDVDKGMYAPSLYVPNMSYADFIDANKDDELISEFAPKSKTIESLIAKTLFVNTLRTYGNKIEPFLSLGTALMSPFVNILFDKTMGYPINFVYGEAASGKSNLLQTIAYSFGFDTRFLSSGNDTALNLLHNMEYYSSTPILYAEIEGYMRKNFETTVKAVYDRNARKRMTAFGKNQDIKAINATLNFASNDRAHRNPQTATRLVYTEFYKDDFNPQEASKINNIREKYLSCVLPKILLRFNDKEKLYTDLKNKCKIIQEFNPNLDLRCVNNIAIAMLGMDYLLQVADFNVEFKEGEEVKILSQNLEKYVKSHQAIIHTEDCFEKFMRIFLNLAKSDKIKFCGEYIFNENKRELSIYVEGTYQLFKKEYKQSEENGVYIPDSKDIRIQALKNEFITYKSKNFGNKKTQRALIIQIPENDEFLNYIFDELVKHQEEIAEREMQKSNPVYTPYMDLKAANADLV